VQVSVERLCHALGLLPDEMDDPMRFLTSLLLTPGVAPGSLSPLHECFKVTVPIDMYARAFLF
jgi:hypothetical protein